MKILIVIIMTMTTTMTLHLFLLQTPESFYEDASQYDDKLTFDNMNLSRPILKVTIPWPFGSTGISQLTSGVSLGQLAGFK